MTVTKVDAGQNQARLYLLRVSGSTANELPDASAKAALRALVPAEAELYCEPKALVEYGTPTEKILDSASELGVDLIVLGVKPATQFAGQPLHRTAATAYKIVTEAICPVLTVRARI
jgi:nucleotide-binding universal stress UspA family protein